MDQTNLAIVYGLLASTLLVTLVSCIVRLWFKTKDSTCTSNGCCKGFDIHVQTNDLALPPDLSPNVDLTPPKNL